MAIHKIYIATILCTAFPSYAPSLYSLHEGGRIKGFRSVLGSGALTLLLTLFYPSLTPLSLCVFVPAEKSSPPFFVFLFPLLSKVHRHYWCFKRTARTLYSKGPIPWGLTPGRPRSASHALVYQTVRPSIWQGPSRFELTLSDQAVLQESCLSIQFPLLQKRQASEPPAAFGSRLHRARGSRFLKVTRRTKCHFPHCPHRHHCKTA